MRRKLITVDINEAAASVAYRCKESIAIYPITPASAMGEQCDLCTSSVQMAHDFALIGQASSLQSQIPFLQFFYGFRISIGEHSTESTPERRNSYSPCSSTPAPAQSVARYLT